MKTNNTIVLLTGIGLLAPALGLVAAFLGVGFLVSICKAAFSLTWIYMLVHVLSQKRMESSSKVGWFAGIFLFGFIVGPFYWYWHLRDANKWGKLAR